MPKNASFSEDKPKTGYPHGAFIRNGAWVPRGYHDPTVDRVIATMLHVRRHNSISPSEYLERLSRWEHATVAAGLLGPPVLGAMSNFTFPDDWSCLSAAIDWAATDAACWVIHCGCPYAYHHWADSGHWVPMKGNPVWAPRSLQGSFA